MNYSLAKRLMFYPILAGLCIVVPYIVTMICIMATMDRIEGMKTGVIPGIISVYVIFGLIFLRPLKLTKILLIFLVSGICYVAMLLIQMNGLFIETGMGNYGYWDIAFTNFCVGLVIWEISYHLIKRIKIKGANNGSCCTIAK